MHDPSEANASKHEEDRLRTPERDYLPIMEDISRDRR
jgi:hypothetical protein